jgi:hypothetical protein
VAIPTLVATPVNTPAPAMQVVVTSNDVTAATYTLWRQDSLGRGTFVRGAVNAVIVGAAFVLDIEHPFDETIQYACQTFTAAGDLIGQSALTSAYTATGYRTWMADPLTPSSAVNIEVVEWPDWSKPVDAAYIPIIGSPDATVVYGTRTSGNGQLVLHARTAAERDGLRGLLAGSGTILVRASSAWDIGVISIGVPTYTEKRLGLAANPARLMSLEVIKVSPVDLTLAPILHTYAELAGYGYTYATLSGHVGLTYLQLAQNPAGL